MGQPIFCKYIGLNFFVSKVNGKQALRLPSKIQAKASVFIPQKRSLPRGSDLLLYRVFNPYALLKASKP